MEKTSRCWYDRVCGKYQPISEYSSSPVCREMELNQCQRYMGMKYLMDTSGIPEGRQFPQVLKCPKCDLAAYKRLNEIKQDIVSFVRNGENIYLTSPYTGNGKTTWAIKLMSKYFDSIWCGNGFTQRGLFIHVPTFLLKCKDFKNTDKEFEEVKRLLPIVDLVIWDDIASTDVSSYDYSNLLMYMDVRCSNGKSNIYTGNITERSKLNIALGSKLTSRIWSDHTEVIVFNGDDKR